MIDELGMDPAVKGEYGRNIFLHACYYGHIEIVKYLAEKYPKLLASVDESNNTGLQLASRQRKNDTVLYLIDELGMDSANEKPTRW